MKMEGDEDFQTQPERLMRNLSMKNRSAVSAEEFGFRYPDRRSKPSLRLPVDVFGLCVDGGGVIYAETISSSSTQKKTESRIGYHGLEDESIVIYVN